MTKEALSFAQSNIIKLSGIRDKEFTAHFSINRKFALSFFYFFTTNTPFLR
ncbi:MAG: hypothetical protein IKM61_01345 [Eubacteriaceae bacterium]|nr:hypothetical protein [Eubacteriaceae bacterium]